MTVLIRNPILITGVLLAAGRGRRMGGTKQLLPWPPGSRSDCEPTTVAAAAFDAIAGFCDRMIVVVGHEAAAVEHALQGRVYTAVIGDSEAEMLESVKIGLAAVIQRSDMDAVLLHPADHPSVCPATVEELINTWRAQPHCAVMPQFQGRGGHPVLIPASMIGPIRSFHRLGGLRQFWLDHPQRCIRVPVDDSATVFDLDYPGDYGAMQRDSWS